MIDRLRASMLGILIAILAIQPSSASQQMMGFFGGGGVTIPTPVSFWNVEEASGARADAVGSNNLTDNNTVTQAVGKVGNAAQFTAANLEYLSIADNASLSTGDIDFAWSAWVYFDSISGSFVPVLSKDNTTSDREYLLVYDVANTRFRWSIGNGATINHVGASSFGAASTGTWYFLYVEHDAAANTIGISVNNGTLDTAATTVAPGDGANPFQIGGWSAFPAYFNGRIDAVGRWNEKLSAAVRSCLWNGGNGRQHPLSC